MVTFDVVEAVGTVCAAEIEGAYFACDGKAASFDGSEFITAEL